MRETSSTIFKDRRREIRLKKSGFERTRFAGASPEQAITYKLASTREELEASFRLVYQSYFKVGLQAPEEAGLRFTKYHLLPSTEVLIAIHHPALERATPDSNKGDMRPKVVGTLSLVFDSEMGLPMEEVCGSAISTFRKAGRKPAEVIALAVHPNFRGINNIMRLFRLMVHYARLHGVTDLGSSVTPRHVNFYRDILLFKAFGEKHTYSSANDLEVQCHFMDITTADTLYQKTYGTQEFDCNLAEFFHTGRPEVMPRPEPWPEETIRYFLNLRDSIRQSLTPHDLEVLRSSFRLKGKHFPF